MAATAMAVSEPTNGGRFAIESSLPYIATVTVQGSADLLLHAWNCEAVDDKSKAKKGSAAKKTDNVESYVRRNDAEQICIPGEYLRMAIVNAAKYRQDPRSPRKSAMDLYKAGIVTLEQLCPLTNVAGELPKTWDFEHKCRVQVQRSGITRTRPAFREGWQFTASFLISLPEYIPQSDLLDVLTAAGKLIGVGDFRPTYGRFGVVKFEVLQEPVVAEKRPSISVRSSGQQRVA